MTDCSNAEIRDLLPDYVHDQLSVTDLARVDQHLVSCAECTEELALLQTVFDARPREGAIDIAAILASLPKPGQGATPERTVAAEVPGVRSITSAPSVVRKTGGFRNWRAVAAVAVVAVGTLSVAVIRDGVFGTKAPAGIDSTSIIALAPNPSQHVEDSILPNTESGVALSIGDVSDYSDEELKAMMARLDKWDGAPSAEPLPGVPIMPPGGS